jgi:hypothetical protein
MEQEKAIVKNFENHGNIVLQRLGTPHKSQYSPFSCQDSNYILTKEKINELPWN